MKKLLLACLMLSAMGSAQAQFISAQVAGGAAVGGVAIGASTGLHVGSFVHAANHGYYGGGYYPYRGYGYGYPGYGYYGYRRPYWGGRHGFGFGVGLGVGFGFSLGFGGPSYPYYNPAPGYAASPDPIATQQPDPAPATQAPQQVTIINNYYNSSTPMSGANSLFGR